MDEELETFLEDQKMKIAEEKACLEQDPPYMEIRRRKGHSLQKENISPLTIQQDGVSLPLGEKYERKKHKLQEELRKDYRKYMAEKDQWDTGDISTVPERRRIPRTVRVRDVATLTEVCGLGWSMCSSEEDCSDEELLLLQGRRLQRERDTRTANKELYTETGHHTSKLQHRNRIPASMATQANERSGSAASQDTVCTSGLLIGSVDLEATLKRRKERYRRELQEQIAEKQRHRRREKELDLKVAVMDSEKKFTTIVSEASGYRRVREINRKQTRDEMIQLDTTKTPESVLQYRTDPLSPCSMPFVPSHLPSHAEAYKTPHNNDENLLNSSRAYGTITGISLLMPSGETRQLSPHNEHSRSTHRQMFLGENEGVGSGLPMFPTHHPQTDKDRLSYKEELRSQIEERAARRRAEREERQRLEAELEANMRAYEPWGRGGAGAPLRDSTGNLITDLKQMHLLNEAATQRQERPGFTQTHSPQIARGSVFTNQQLSPQQLQEQDQYKAYLRYQMEEKQRKQAEERERMRAEEEREERRLAEQREKIRREYEEEQESRKRREMEQKLKNEELARLAEERRRDAEKKKKEEVEKERAALRKLEEEERRIRLQQDFSLFQVPPSAGNRNQLRVEKDRSEVVNELCALRRCLHSEQRRLEEQLLQTEWDHLPSPSLTDVFLPRTRHSRSRNVEGGRGSVLLSESEFIDLNGAAFPVPPDVERKSPKLSARERRRLANLQSAVERQQVPQQSFNVRKIRDTNTLRMNKLQVFSHHNVPAGGCFDDEDGHGDEHFNLQSPARPSSIDTATTEPWIRAESSDTLRRLMSGSEL